MPALLVLSTRAGVGRAGLEQCDLAGMRGLSGSTDDLTMAVDGTVAEPVVISAAAMVLVGMTAATPPLEAAGLDSLTGAVCRLVET